MKTDWRGKISALLHDPLTKPLDIQTHEKMAEEICKLVGIESVKGGSEEDKTASAFDRFPLPFERWGDQIRVRLDELDSFIHPLSGDRLEVDYSEIDSKKQEYIEEFKNVIVELREKNPEDEKFYHALWWELPNIIDIAQFLPADTRIPNHSIIDHLDSTAAVRACVKGGEVNSSLIMLSIGPVQEIISQARKTIDLWAGSYLLSHLIYQAIEHIGLNYGFDAIIYPYLRGNEFVRKTLQENGVKLLDRSNLMRTSAKVASLPNVVLAILPTGDVEQTIEDCKKRIREKWEQLAMDALNRFKSFKPTNSYNEEEFMKQIKLFPIINATYVRLTDDVEILKKMTGLFKHSDFQKHVELIEKIKSHGGYSFNEGTFYRYIYRFLASKMSAMKAIRYFPAYDSDATLNGRREADDLGDPVRACVEVIDRQKDEEHIDLLGTLNTTKRFLRDVLEIKGLKYESTEDIAQQNENPDRNKYIAILMMDGDSMGKWVSGQKAPMVKDVLHSEVLQRMGEIGINTKDLELPFVTPSYHRAVSRTLGVFSSFVEHVVEERYKGMLIYTGGDDVLAMLPASKALECANELRKIYSGIGSVKIADKYEFNNQMLYVNGRPYTTMMGEKATISAGIAVIHQKSPLRFGIQLAREAEKYAKENIGRNAFAVFVMKRSGQIERTGSHWDVNGVDVVTEALSITEKAEKLRLSHRSLYKFRDEDLLALPNEFLDDLIGFILKKSDAQNKDSEEFRTFAAMFKGFFKTICEGSEVHVSSTETYDRNLEKFKKPLDLLRTIRFMKRGEER